jgi:hypothetical protein
MVVPSRPGTSVLSGPSRGRSLAARPARLLQFQVASTVAPWPPGQLAVMEPAAATPVRMLHELASVHTARMVDCLRSLLSGASP